MAKLISAAALLCILGSPAFAFNVEKCNQQCKTNCSGKTSS